jgi:hypothetical protein
LHLWRGDSLLLENSYILIESLNLVPALVSLLGILEDGLGFLASACEPTTGRLT